jgi:hypothetical protein
MSRYSGPPMDLNSMRSMGVTRIDVHRGCGHQATYDVSDLPRDLAAPRRSVPASPFEMRWPAETGPTGQATGFAEDCSDGTITQSPRAVIDDGRVFVETPLFGYQSFDDHF